MASREYSKDPAVVKKMAALLMQGATMLQETCPLDGLPLFRLRSGEVVCPVHGRVLIVTDEREALDVEVEDILYKAMHTAALRLREELDKGEPPRIREWIGIIKDIEEVLSARIVRKQASQDTKPVENRKTLSKAGES